MDWETVTRGGIVAQRFRFSAAGEGAHPTGLVSEIKAFINRSDLPASVRGIAVGLFDRIAAAEGQVHGIPPEEVHLHELADWDSIIDMVAAAVVIDAVGPATWVCPSLPLGTGTVRCAHGLLPVPAPAVDLLCRGARMRSDGVEGERVTPTGAAILAYLGAFEERSLGQGRLVASGYGAGTREFPGLPNVLRMLVLDPGAERLPGFRRIRLPCCAWTWTTSRRKTWRSAWTVYGRCRACSAWSAARRGVRRGGCVSGSRYWPRPRSLNRWRGPVLRRPRHLAFAGGSRIAGSWNAGKSWRKQRLSGRPRSRSRGVREVI
jgi:hypothetical protein